VLVPLDFFSSLDLPERREEKKKSPRYHAPRNALPCLGPRAPEPNHTAPAGPDVCPMGERLPLPLFGRPGPTSASTYFTPAEVRRAATHRETLQRILPPSALSFGPPWFVQPNETPDRRAYRKSGPLPASRVPERSESTATSLKRESQTGPPDLPRTAPNPNCVKPLAGTSARSR